MTNTENAGEEIVLDQKEEVLNLRQEEDNSEENNEKPKTKDASSKGENQAEEIEEEVEEEEEEKDQNIVQEIREVNLQEQQDEKDDNEEKEKKDDNEEKEEKDDKNQEKSEENENEDNNQKPQEEVNLRIVRDNDDDDDVKKSDLYLDLQPNLKVKVEWFKKDDDMNIEFSTTSKSKVLLHWGVFKNNNTSQWCQPNNQFYPRLTSEPDAFSLNTEFSCLQDDDLEQKISIRLPTDSFDEFNFVFYNKDEDIWHNNFGQDYHIKNE